MVRTKPQEKMRTSQEATRLMEGLLRTNPTNKSQTNASARFIHMLIQDSTLGGSFPRGDGPRKSLFGDRLSHEPKARTSGGWRRRPASLENTAGVHGCLLPHGSRLRI